MVNDFEEEVKALEEYGHDCCARIDDRIHECCKRIREAHEQELDRLERENEELRRQLESLMLDSEPMTDENMARHGWYRALDADKKPIRLGDKVYQVKGGWVYTVKSISFYPDNTTVTFECEHGFGSDSAHNLRHYHEPTVEDVLREMHAELDEVTALYVGEAIGSDDRDRDEARIFAEYAAKLQLREDA